MRDQPRSVSDGERRQLPRRPLLSPQRRRHHDAATARTPRRFPALVAHFVECHARAFGKNVRFISREALETLCACAWPGNVRQLSHAIQSALMMTDSDRISLGDLPDSMTLNECLVETIHAVPPAPNSAIFSHESVTADSDVVMQSLDCAIARASKDALTPAL